MSKATIDYANHKPPGRMPDEWPLLGPEHIRRGDFGNGTNCACLGGWVLNVTSSSSNQWRLYGRIIDLIDGDDVGAWNDSHARKTVARLWNKVGESFGYVV